MQTTVFQNMRELRQAIAANVRELYNLRQTVRIRRTAADHDASLAMQLEETVEMLEAAELNLRVLPGYRNQQLKIRARRPAAKKRAA